MSILDVEGYKAGFNSEMEALRVKVTAGDRQAVFTAMELFFRGVHMGIASECPGWLAHAALIPLNEFAEGQHDHMEHAFGIHLKPMTKPRRANRRIERKVFEAVQETLDKSRGLVRRKKKITKVFEEVAKELSMKTGTVKDRYYDYTERVEYIGHDKSFELVEHFARRRDKEQRF